MTSAAKSVESKIESETSDKLTNYSIDKALAKLESKRRTDFESELTVEMQTIKRHIVGFIKKYPPIDAKLADKTVSLDYKIHENALNTLADIYNVECVRDHAFLRTSMLTFGPSVYDEIDKTAKRLRELVARKRAREECIVDTDRSSKARTDVA